MNRALAISSLLRRSCAFTFVETMIVIGIIGVIATLALPNVISTKASARGAQFINDLRHARAVFAAHAHRTGQYPVDGTPGVIPAGMAQGLGAVRWTEPTAIGGQWDWDYLQFGVTAGVSVYLPEFTDAQMAKIDARIDDGDLSTGAFRQRPAGFIYILE